MNPYDHPDDHDHDHYHYHDHDHDHDRGLADDHDHDRGLAFDLSTMLERRNILKMFVGGAGLVALAACGSDAVTTSASDPAATAQTSAAQTSAAQTSPAGTVATSAESCTVIPEETAGPFPGDGSNGINVLSKSGVVRSDIRSSFGSSTTVAQGVPVTIDLTIVDSANGCAPLVGGAVYIWHCDREGRYSMYSETVKGENYLRGVQPTDASGLASFTSVFPACYDGRWPHMHFEIYPSLAAASDANGKVATSQLALPQDVCETVYATSGYETSVGNLARVSLGTDMVFNDGATLETPMVSGNVTDGFKISMTVAV